MAVAGILDELGFAKADKQCVESLTEVHLLMRLIFKEKSNLFFLTITIFSGFLILDAAIM